MQSAIQVSNLSRSFTQIKKEPGLRGAVKSLLSPDRREIKAVRNISFDIKPGEVVGFIGPNGAGKTTTLKILSGLLHPSSGEVTVLGFRPYDRKHEYQKQFSIVMGQKAQLWWDLPAIESFKLNKEIYEISDKDFKERLKHLSDLLDVNDIIDVQVRKLSLGQRMKCELLAALLHNPKVIFLDEPTIGLDVVMQKKVREFLKEYNKINNATIILTSHYMEDVKELCNRLIVIDKGKLVFDGTVDELTNKYTPKKYLKIIFNKAINRKSLEKYGEILEITKHSVVLSVGREVHAQIAGKILQKFDVDDLDIAEPKLEDVISLIFSQN